MIKSIILTIMIVALTTPLSARILERNETVYAALDGGGFPEKTEVVTWLRTSGDEPVTDMATLNGVKNLKSRDMPVLIENQIRFSEPARDIFYKGTTDKALPLSINIRYTLNGRPISADAIEGKSGMLQMEIFIKNMTEAVEHVSYREIGTGREKTVRKKIATPFIVRVETDLYINCFSDVNAPESAFAVIGNIMKMTWIAVPFPETTLTLTAQVTEAKTPAIMFIAVPGMPQLPEIELESKLNDIYKGVDTVGKNLIRLKNGAQEIHKGQVRIWDGLKQVKDGTGQLIQASSAQQEMVDGAIKINEGMKEGMTPFSPFLRLSKKTKPLFHYMDIQKELLRLEGRGGPFSEEILAFFESQGKDVPPVAEFPGIEITKNGLISMDEGLTEMVDGAEKLVDGSDSVADNLALLKRKGTDAIKEGIRDNGDELLRELAAVEKAKKMAGAFDRFSGEPSTVKSAVQFIMKTP